MLILKKYYLLFSSILFLSFPGLTFSRNSTIPLESFVFESGSIPDAEIRIEDFLKDQFPIISDYTIADIINKKIVSQLNPNDPNARPDLMYSISFSVPANYLVDTAKILWQLNLPQFESQIFQLYGADTLYIDTWKNVVGKPTDKTYTGNFRAFRIRNWPTWKDPDPAKKDLEATPPGPNNPLGLFVVHYDERSLRYFHGTNRPGVLKKELRYESHGCVRNENDNIQKMKEFILKRVIKSKDLTSWIKSKRSMQFEFAEEDKFPVRILYKTFEVNKDENGFYIILFRDIYNYAKKRADPNWNDLSLITLSTKENIISEYQKKFGVSIPKEKLEFIVDWLLKNGDEYQKYYFEDLKTQFLMD
ncbi:hypothetical protein BH10BAC5_BH10BAC5_19020 [soil metagenome]